MKASHLIIRIPEPCHEDWNSMQPDAKGKFCNSCNKSVFDFSNKTDTQIRDILLEYKDQKVCGHFKKTQINRPLNISINVADLPKNVSVTRAFAIALFIVFGTFLFSCTNEQGQKFETIEVIDLNKQYEDRLTGVTFSPPDTLNEDTISFEKGNLIESVCSVTSGAVTIDGGLELVELPVYEEQAIEKDSTAKEEPLIDHAIVGQMVSYIMPGNDTAGLSTNDSLMTKNTDQMKTNNTISKNKVFVIYPNPSNGEFTVSYEVTKKADVSLVIYDLKGVLVRSLVNVHDQHEGRYQIPVNLNDLPNGIYIVSLINGDKKSTERLVLEK